MFEKLKHKTLRTSVFKDLPNAQGGSPGPSLTATTGSPASGFTTFKGNEASRLTRCKHCGFICDKERDVYYPEGTWAGIGVTNTAQATAGTSIGDRNVPETSLTEHLLYWKLDDNTDSTVVVPTVGAVGSVQNGVNTEDMTIAGKLGTALQCSDLGAEGSTYIHSTVNIYPSEYNEFSLAIWFKATDTSFGQHIIQQGRGNSGGWSRQTWAAATDVPEFHVSLGWIDVTAGSIERDDFLTFYMGRWRDDTAGHISIGYAFTDTADWHHVAVSVADLSTLPVAHIWIDGVHRDMDWGTASCCNISGAGEGLRLCQDPAEQGPFYGGVDDFRVFSKAINSLEVLALYNSGAGTTRYGSSITSVDQYYTRDVAGGCPGCGSYTYV